MSTDLEKLKARVNQCQFAVSLGFELVEVRPGYARVEATVRPDCDNWLGRTHGGWVMALADHASSVVGNTIPGNYVAIQFNIHFVSTPSVGERLVAEGRVLHQGRTLGLVDMTVYGKDKRLIAYATSNVLSVGDRAPRPRG